MDVTGRAQTPEQKREVVERLLASWLAIPELRLGQLIVNAMQAAAPFYGADLFYVEDRKLLAQVVDYETRIVKART